MIELRGLLLHALYQVSHFAFFWVIKSIKTCIVYIHLEDRNNNYNHCEFGILNAWADKIKSR